jgi:hypothetical protein
VGWGENNATAVPFHDRQARLSLASKTTFKGVVAEGWGSTKSLKMMPHKLAFGNSLTLKATNSTSPAQAYGCQFYGHHLAQ